MHATAGDFAALHPGRYLFAKRPELRRQGIGFRQVRLEGRLGGDALDLALGIDAPLVLAAGEAIEPAADGAVARNQRMLFMPAKVGNGLDAIASEPRLKRLAHTPDEADGLRPQEGHR